jgi:hypothetical protein
MLAHANGLLDSACSLVCVVHLGPLENVAPCIHKLSGTTKDASDE